MNFYFCQFLFSSLFIIKYCFWPGYIFVNSLPTAGDKVICWREDEQNAISRKYRYCSAVCCSQSGMGRR
ncbi:hypothetical protein BXA16_14225 [Salmonella enterica subsp. enterica serovar Typhimurium]|nr:hypothetical protein BXA16_14225 [Salmonella enterica subsp. enterica serovar Typhimurium]